MSKELTEKWKKKELQLGSYYVKDASGRVFIDEYIKIVYGDDVEPTVFRYEEVIVEVIERVPSYDQFVELTEKVDELTTKCNQLKQENSELVQKIHILEKQLDIAVKALRDYADEENWSTATTEINTDYFKFEYSMYGLEHNGFIDAQKALKEIDSLGKCDKSHVFPSENVKGGVDDSQ